KPLVPGHAHPKSVTVREIRAAPARRDRLSNPGRPDLGELATWPDQPRKSLHSLGGGLGALDPALDRRRTLGLDHPPPAVQASPPDHGPGEYADHSAADSVMRARLPRARQAH